MNKIKQENEIGGLSDFFDKSSFFLILMLLLLLIVSQYVILLPPNYGFSQFQVGQIPLKNMYAEFDFQTEDLKATETARQKAYHAVLDHYLKRSELTLKIRNDVKIFLSEVEKRHHKEQTGTSYTAENAIQNMVAGLSDPALKCLLRILENENLKNQLDQLINLVLMDGILSQSEYKNFKSNQDVVIVESESRRRTVSAPSDEIRNPQKAADRVLKILQYYADPNKEQLIEDIRICLEQIFSRGNMVYYKDFTENLRKQSAAEVKPKMKEVCMGTPLVKKNQPITNDDITMLNAYQDELHKHEQHSNIYSVLRQNILLSLAMILMMSMYLFRVRPRIARSNRSLCVLWIITVLALLLNKASYNGFHYLSEDFSIPRMMIYYALPIGFSSLLVTVLFGIRTSLFIGLFVSVISALPMENPFQMVVIGMLTNTGGSMAVRNVQNYRSYFTRSFAGIYFSSMLSLWIFFLKLDMFSQGRTIVIWLLIFPLAVGLLTAILAQLVLFLLELLFDVTTTMSLAICCDFNHPLLKEMQLKAPGTYHHCLMVSNLAEQAARASGLNPIKARVCALFHDIGKIVEPDFFIENNPGRNMHQSLDPMMSAMIILSHVTKHGPELARQHKLKKILCDAIRQHHGTDLVAYFYRKAQNMFPDKHISENEFRYPGPLPSDKEICLVMLADCCEAASRSLDTVTPETLEQLIQNIFRGKIRNGQLDASELSMKELAMIQKSFVSTLEHVNHTRIVYPKDEKKDEDDLFMASRKDIPQA